MKTSDFDYYLPKNLIAQEPMSPRDKSRLLILDKKNNQIMHDYFYNLSNYLDKNCVLVFNDTKVMPARIFVEKKTGGRIEILFLKEVESKIWQVLIRGSIKLGDILILDKTLKAKVFKKEAQTILLKLNQNKNKVMEFLQKNGQMPLPPYIRQKMAEKEAAEKYQTIFAKHLGSAAAPTASFHFTERLFKKLKAKNINYCFITLHVGLGTFLPIKVNNLKEHKMHSEFYNINKTTAQFLNENIRGGKKIIAVGTTVLRALESAIDKKGKIKAGSASTNLFIYPPYKFKVVKGLITNFHLPKTSLLTLVCAFAGKKKIMRAYKIAIKEKYRFYSFGDGMIIK